MDKSSIYMKRIIQEINKHHLWYGKILNTTSYINDPYIRGMEMMNHISFTKQCESIQYMDHIDNKERIQNDLYNHGVKYHYQLRYYCNNNNFRVQNYLWEERSNLVKNYILIKKYDMTPMIYIPFIHRHTLLWDK